MDQNSVLEIVTSRILPDFPQEAYAAAASAIEPWLAAQPGFVSRRLGQAEDGSWIDCVEWRSMEDALAVAKTIMSEPAAAPMIQMLDPLSVTIRHFSVRVSQ